MKIASEAWRALIAMGAKALNVPIDAQQIEQFGRHAQLMLHWNSKINLTAIDDPRQIAIKHYIDSLVPLAVIGESDRCLDIGTGAGFPGIPLKIARPQLEMSLTDAVRKKISFVKEAIRTLGLTHISALHSRAELLAQEEAHRFQYDVILSRAVADLPALVRLAEPLLAPNGRIVALKGPKLNSTNDAIRTLFEQKFKTTMLTYELPLAKIPRVLVVLQRIF